MLSLIKSNIKYFFTASQEEQNRLLEQAPADVLRLIAEQLPTKDIIHLCETKRRFNELICNDINFWRNKVRIELTDDLMRIRLLSLPKLKRRLYLAETAEDEFEEALQMSTLSRILWPPKMSITNREDGEQPVDYYLAKDGYEKFVRRQVERTLRPFRSYSPEDFEKYWFQVCEGKRNVCTLLNGVIAGIPIGVNMELVTEIYSKLPRRLQERYLSEAIELPYKTVLILMLTKTPSETIVNYLNSGNLDYTARHFFQEELQKRHQ